jgi:hypothetical protein
MQGCDKDSIPPALPYRVSCTALLCHIQATYRELQSFAHPCSHEHGAGATALARVTCDPKSHGLCLSSLGALQKRTTRLSFVFRWSQLLSPVTSSSLRYLCFPICTMPERLDRFVGTNEEYVSYLEKELLAARQNPNAECPRIAKKRRTCDSPYWMTCAKQLVKQTPMAQSWTSSLKDSGIHEIMKSGDAVTCLLDSKLESQLSAQVFTAEAGKVDETDDYTTAYLRTYARTTSMRSTLASTALALANFQKFLVISACAVLAEGNTPIAKVYEIVRICVGNKSTDEYCKRTMTAAKYLNELIDTLDIHDWGQRAAELLLLCGCFDLSFFDSLTFTRESGAVLLLQPFLFTKE